MIQNSKFFWKVLKATFTEWNSSSATKDSASLAYYAIFSIPGLLIMIIWGLGHFFGEEAIRGQISIQISGIMGQDVAKGIEGILVNALIDKNNVFMKTVGVGALIFGSTTLFFQLQHSLNSLWEVESAPKKALVKFLLDRMNSLGMIFILGALLMSSMVLSSLISLFNKIITQYFGIETYMLVELVNFATGFGLVMLLFALMFKVLPDVLISWKPVWKGAFLTTTLFTLGKFLLSLYFNQVKPTSAFGAAGTVILIMMWINYSCMLIFFGALFTKVYTYKTGYEVAISKHARWTSAKLYADNLKQKKDLQGNKAPENSNLEQT